MSMITDTYLSFYALRVQRALSVLSTPTAPLSWLLLSPYLVIRMKI